MRKLNPAPKVGVIGIEEIQTACEEKKANIAGEPETVPIVTAKDVKSIPRKKKNICRKTLRRSLRLFLQRSNEYDKGKHHYQN
ncbi:hypothetical protein J6590_072650 [Homalodisca vitripennis]|nr:hypothetical protein J6590_072650 [Homalodisca vitripennis]